MGYSPVINNQSTYAAPTTGQTVAVPSFGGSEYNVFLEPAGLLAALTLTFSTTNLIDGQIINISCSQIVTTLTMTGGTILGALTTIAANGVARFGYSATGNKWFRLT